MSMILTCDKCGQPIDRDGILGDRSWVQAVVSLDEPAWNGRPKDYHRDCARTITLAEVWKQSGLVPL